MEIRETQIPEVKILKTPVFQDVRGYFYEGFRRDALVGAGIDLDWKQDNLSFSARNVIRGLHYQLVHAQAKLIRVVHGAIVDVIVDIRKSSPTFGKHVVVDLKAGDGLAVLVPAGFAHGFAALEPETTVLYKVDESYYPKNERTILWNDPELAIEWRVRDEDAIVSEKDRRGSSFRSAEVFP